MRTARRIINREMRRVECDALKQDLRRRLQVDIEPERGRDDAG